MDQKSNKPAIALKIRQPAKCCLPPYNLARIANYKQSIFLEKTDFQILGGINGFAISLNPSIADPQYKAAPHYAPEVHAIFNQIVLWRNHA